MAIFFIAPDLDLNFCEYKLFFMDGFRSMKTANLNHTKIKAYMVSGKPKYLSTKMLANEFHSRNQRPGLSTKVHISNVWYMHSQ